MKIKTRYLLSVSAFLLVIFLIFSLTQKNYLVFSSEAVHAEHVEKNVTADLGGVPVSIPPYFSEFVEYNGDVSFSDNTTGKVARNSYSKLKSFGFYLRYPDGAGLSNEELKKNKASYTIYNTMWLRVGVRSGEIYPGDGLINRISGYLIMQDNPSNIGNYTKLPELKYDLIAYVANEINSKKNMPYRESEISNDVFIHKNSFGDVDAYIRCSKRPHEAAPCKHIFSLEPSVKAYVEVGYRRGLLPEWSKIQVMVTNKIMSFKNIN